MKMRIVRSRFCGTDGARKDYGTRCIVHHFTRKHGNEDGYSSKTQMIFWGTSGNWKLRVESLEIDKNLNHTHTRHKPIKQLTTIRDNFISVQNHQKWSKTKGYGVRWTCKMKLLSWSEGTNLVLSFFCSNFVVENGDQRLSYPVTNVVVTFSPLPTRRTSASVCRGPQRGRGKTPERGVVARRWVTAWEPLENPLNPINKLTFY